MREILFRGKRKSDGEWVYGNLITNDGRPYIVGDIFDVDEQILVYGGAAVHPESVGQYIGIKTTDNNTKLFDGDFVSILELFADGTMEDCHSGVIEFRNGQFLIDEIPISEYTEEHDILLIGNIHDNPHVLKEPV